MLLETGLTAAAVAFVELISAGCTDILLHRAGKPHFHHKGFKGLLGGAGRNFNQATSTARLGKALGGTAFLGEVGIGLLRGPLYYPWLIGVGTSFFANWASMIYAAQDCQQPGAGHIGCPVSNIITGPGGGGDLHIDCVRNIPCAAVSITGVNIPNGCYATITFTGRWEHNNAPGLPVNVDVWLQDNSTGQSVASFNTDSSKPGNYKGVGMGYQTGLNTYQGGGGYTLKFRDNIGFASLKEGWFALSAYGRPIELIPHGCTPKPLVDYWNHLNPFS